MAYQSKTTTNYGGSLKNALGGVKTGAILFAIGTVILFLNEGNYVKTNKSIQEVKKSVVQVNDVSSIDQSLEGKLICAHAFADTQDIIEDKPFGISEKAIGIIRDVEYYQYRENARKETKEKIGGGQETTTTYTYQPGWVSAPVDSNRFADPDYRSSNFTLANIEAEIVSAENVSFGAYKLPKFIISSMSGNTPANVNMNLQLLGQWEDHVSKNMTALGKKKDGQMVQAQGNVVYFGKSASSPAVGDVKVTIFKITPVEISIIAKVIGNTFEEFTASNGYKFPNPVEMGTVSADTMIKQAEAENKASTWFLRLLGVILVVLGLKSLFSILPALFKVIPFLGSIIGAGVGLVCTVGGAAWSLIVIAIAWLFYRPIIGILFLTVAIAGIVFLKSRSKNKANGAQKANAPAITAEPAVWDCPCGHAGNKGKFCAECGKPR